MFNFITIMMFAAPAIIVVGCVALMAMMFVEKTDRMVMDDYNEMN